MLGTAVGQVVPASGATAPDQRAVRREPAVRRRGRRHARPPVQGEGVRRVGEHEVVRRSGGARPGSRPAAAGRSAPRRARPRCAGRRRPRAGPTRPQHRRGTAARRLEPHRARAGVEVEERQAGQRPAASRPCPGRAREHRLAHPVGVGRVRSPLGVREPSPAAAAADDAAHRVPPGLTSFQPVAGGAALDVGDDVREPGVGGQIGFASTSAKAVPACSRRSASSSTLRCWRLDRPCWLGPTRCPPRAPEVDLCDLEPVVAGRASRSRAGAGPSSPPVSNRHSPAWSPRPTRPRSWCSWDSPNRSAPHDHHHGGVRDVDAHLDHRGRQQQVDLPRREGAHHRVLVLGRHPAVQHRDPHTPSRAPVDSTGEVLDRDGGRRVLGASRRRDRRGSPRPGPSSSAAAAPIRGHTT